MPEYNLEFKTSYENYDGLILTTPDGPRTFFEPKFMHLKPKQVGYDRAAAYRAAEVRGMDVIAGPKLRALLNQWYGVHDEET